MLGLSFAEILIIGTLLGGMVTVVGAIVFVVVKLGGSQPGADSRRIAELERQVADLQRNQKS